MSATVLSTPSASSIAFTRNLRIFLNETRYEFTRLLRTRSFSLSVIGFPVLFYFFFGLIMNRSEHIGGVSAAKYMLAGYTVFGMVGAALFGVGVGLCSEIAAGWLELKRASPLPPLAYLLAKCCSAMVFGTLIVSILTLLGIFVGHVSLTLPQFAAMLGLAIVGVLPFVCMGLALALLVPFSSAPGVANMLYLPMSFLGGLWVPVMMLPHILQRFALLLPTYHLAQLMLRAFGFESAGSATSHWLGLLSFALIMLGIAAFAFRRLESNS